MPQVCSTRVGFYLIFKSLSRYIILVDNKRASLIFLSVNYKKESFVASGTGLVLLRSTRRIEVDSLQSNLGHYVC